MDALRDGTIDRQASRSRSRPLTEDAAEPDPQRQAPRRQAWPRLVADAPRGGALRRGASTVTWNSRTPASSQESEDLTLGLSVPDGEPSPSRRSTPTPAPSSPSDGPESRTSETSFELAGVDWDMTAGATSPTAADGSEPASRCNSLVRRLPLPGPQRRRQAGRARRSPQRPRLRLPRPCGAPPTSRHPPRKRSGPPLLSSRQGPWGAPRSPGGTRVLVGLPDSRRSALRSAAATTPGVHRRAPR